jgi:hypothetical protein
MKPLDKSFELSCTNLHERNIKFHCRLRTDCGQHKKFNHTTNLRHTWYVPDCQQKITIYFLCWMLMRFTIDLSWPSPERCSCSESTGNHSGSKSCSGLLVVSSLQLPDKVKQSNYHAWKLIVRELLHIWLEKTENNLKKTENARILGSAKSRKLLVTNQLYLAVSRHMQTLGLQDR